MTTIDELERKIDDLSGKVEMLRAAVEKATNFQVGFQAISKTLTYLCIVAAAAATVYGALIR